MSTREALCAAALDEQLDAHQRAASLQPSSSSAATPDDAAAAASAETRRPSVPRVASSRAGSVDPKHGQSGKTPERELRQSSEGARSERKGSAGPLRPDGGGAGRLEDMVSGPISDSGGRGGGRRI